MVSARRNWCSAIAVKIGEMGSKAYLGGEGVRYRTGVGPVLVLNEEGIAKLLVGDRRTRCWAASREVVAPALELGAFTDEWVTVIFNSHEANIKLLCKANAL